MSDWRHFEYFRCTECGRDWRDWSPHSYDHTDSRPCFQKTLCEECFEERHQADLIEQEMGGAA